MADVLVVGAGVGGLAAAARLAAAGHAVTVCEQAATIGGKLGLHVADGFRFDTGPSLLTMPHVVAELFSATGAPLDDVLPLERVDPIARYRFPDGTQLDVRADLPATCAAMDAALGAGAGAQWRGFMERAGRIYAAVEDPFLSRPLEGPVDLLRQSVRVRDLRTIAPWATLRDLGHRYLRDPRLRMLLDRYATYTGSDPRRAPAALASVPYAEQAFGGWYVPGGLRRLGEAVADRAAERGAVVRTRADVAALTPEGGGWTARLADGQVLRSDLVVANADAAHLYGDLLPDRLGGRLRRRLDRVAPSLSGFVLLLGLRGATPGRAHHTVLFPADYDAEFDALFGPPPRRPRRPARPPQGDPGPMAGAVADPTIYVSVPDDPAVAPDGHEAWFILVNAPRQGQRGAVGAPVDWDAPGAADAYADHLLRLLAARGLDVRDRVVHRATITPADLARRTRALGGAIYGTSSNGPRAAFLRPANRSPLPGLYLVGGSAHPGGGLPLVMLSARIVADLIGRA